MTFYLSSSLARQSWGAHNAIYSLGNINKLIACLQRPTFFNVRKKWLFAYFLSCKGLTRGQSRISVLSLKHKNTDRKRFYFIFLVQIRNFSLKQDKVVFSLNALCIAAAFLLTASRGGSSLHWIITIRVMSSFSLTESPPVVFTQTSTPFMPWFTAAGRRGVTAHIFLPFWAVGTLLSAVWVSVQGPALLVQELPSNLRDDSVGAPRRRGSFQFYSFSITNGNKEPQPVQSRAQIKLQRTTNVVIRSAEAECGDASSFTVACCSQSCSEGPLLLGRGGWFPCSFLTGCKSSV